MNKVRNFGIMLLVLVVFVCVFFIVSAVTEKPQMSIDFSAGTANGSVISLHDVMLGRGGVLIFIDPEIEGSGIVLEKIVNNVEPERVIAVSVSELSEQEQKKLMTEKMLALDNLCFEGSEAISSYNIGNAPVTYFIDSKGYVTDAFIGDVKEETVKKCIEKIKAA